MKKSNHYKSPMHYLLVAVISITFQATPSLSFSQEVLTDLTTNPVITKKYAQKETTSEKKQSSLLNTIPLPFLDDFSKESIYPDPALWLDSNVYINRDYPIQPPTLGAATFDGLSKTGCPYDTTLLSVGGSYAADTLKSKPIDLSLPPSDSIYFSFFWQAEGRGNDPEPGDTLLLDFLNPTTGIWTNIWYKNGYNPSISDTAFRLVHIPIKDTAFLKNAFQFRFRNRATINGNVDHWHIDYILLDKNRNMGDTIFSDVAFTYNCQSLLKNYYAMPWKQYIPSEMKTKLSLLIRNNDKVEKNTSFGYEIINNLGGSESIYSGGSDNCNPYIPNGYWNNPAMSNPPIGSTPYAYPTMTDTSSFTIECALGTTLNDLNKWNDTLRFKQNFYNYYAYDDGTVEAGYGLNIYGGQIAYKFALNAPDTLVAVQMLFNWMPPKVSQRQFRIRVWNDAGGTPGSVIYEDTLVSPKYEYQFHTDGGNLVNMFYPYKLKSAKPLSGIFYVGLIQFCCNGNNELLNIGYDKNTNASSKMFYNVGNGWNKTSLAQSGSWMIRPVFKDKTGLLAVYENTVNPAPFTLFPNPSPGKFIISHEPAIHTSRYHVRIYNLHGEIVLQEMITGREQSIVLDAPDGIYFVCIVDEQGRMFTQKLILAK